MYVRGGGGGGGGGGEWGCWSERLKPKVACSSLAQTTDLTFSVHPTLNGYPPINC